MQNEEGFLLDVASSVSDGRPVDWEAAQQQAKEDEERDIVRNLKAIASLAELHRSLDPRPTPAEVDAAATTRAAPGTSPTLRAGTNWGHLRILETVGQGSFGEVYRAWDTTLDREVALKLYKHSRRRAASHSAMDEGRLLARVRHPNVVTVHGADRHAGWDGIWMEYIRGRSLADLVVKQGPLGAREAALVGLEVCRALAATHRVGLIHGDVKARNVMREEGGRIILMDFGAGAAPAAAENAGQISGTPLYMAPELFDGEHISVRSDIYSVGVLLHYLVTGRFPVDGDSLSDVAKAHKLGHRRLLRDERSDLPEAFVAVVERAAAADPAGRFESAGAIEAALVRSLGLDPAITPGSAQHATEGPRPWTVRRRLALAAVVLVAAVGGLLAARRLGGLSFVSEPRTAESDSRAANEPSRSAVRSAETTAANPSAQAVAERPGPGSQRPTATASFFGVAVPPEAITPTDATSRQGPEPAASRSTEAISRLSIPRAGVQEASYTVQAALFKTVAGTAQPLSSDSRVTLGDKLYLEFQASVPVHLYVVNEDEQGAAFLLFPLPGQKLRNPLPAGARLRLPGEQDGRPLFWQVTSEGTREHFLLVASQERLVELEADLLELERVQSGRPLTAAPLEPERLLRFRGIGGLAAGESPARLAPGRLAELTQRLTTRQETVRGIWIRELSLENSGR